MPKNVVPVEDYLAAQGRYRDIFSNRKINMW